MAGRSQRVAHQVMGAALAAWYRTLGRTGDLVPWIYEWNASRHLRRLREQHASWARRDAAEGSWSAAEARRWSQNGEDGLIAELTTRVGAPGRWFVEIGASDGGENCTRALAEAGWSGAWVEADPGRAALARSLGLDQVEIIEARAERATVSALLDAHGVPAEPDVLVVDIDGDDRGVLEAVLAHRRPRVLVLEYNAAYPPPASWSLPERAATGWDGTDRFGASLQALVDTAVGYELVVCDRTGVNACFVRTDLAGLLDLPDSPRAAYRPAAFSRHPFGHVRSRAAVAAPATLTLEDAALLTVTEPRLEGPSVVAPGGVVGVSVNVRNGSATPLSSGSPGGFALVLRWVDADAPPAPDAVRTPLAHPVPAGRSRRQVLWLEAPGSPGHHRLRVTGVVEGVAWLEFLDGDGRVADLEVTVSPG